MNKYNSSNLTELNFLNVSNDVLSWLLNCLQHVICLA